MDAVFIAFFIISCVLLYMYLTRNANYWKDRNVAYVRPLLLWGNLKPLIFLQQSPGSFLGSLYRSTEALGQRFLGIFLFNCEPGMLIRDPELIKRVLVQDFDHFQNRNVDVSASCDRMGARNLFVIRDAKWKYLRTKLSPIFTSGKLKQMFILMKEIVSDLLKAIDENIKSEDGELKPLDCKEIIGKYTTDVINVCAFNIRSHSLSNADSPFRYFGRKIFNSSVKRSVEMRAFFFMNRLAKALRFVFFEKDSSKFMSDIFGEILSEREKSVVTRNDFADVLIRLRKDLEQMHEGENPPEELRELDDDSVVAQAALFFTAGFETTSDTIMSALYELSLQPEIQDRLREEINESLEETGGVLQYDSVLQMKYLDMTVSETLRKYPPMPFIDRVCTKDYKIPDSDVVIKKGTPVFIALYDGLHYDPNYFPDPEKFYPERFSDEGKANIRPYSYIPFGEGPHICLGMRFGLLNSKTALALILSKYKVETCDKTMIPLEMNPRSLILSPKGTVYLKFIPLNC